MPKRDMSMSVFRGILKHIPETTRVVSLQGEGEPVICKDLWAMAELIHTRGHQTYTITNGGYRVTDTLLRRVECAFDRIGVSIDTVDPQFATRIGRPNLGRVLRSLERFIKALGSKQVDVYSVALNRSHLNAVRMHLDRYPGVRHIIQPLQSKDDYANHYLIQRPADPPAPGCRYIAQDLMRFYDVNGTEMPCCYIKDTRGYQSADMIRASSNEAKCRNAAADAVS